VLRAAAAATPAACQQRVYLNDSQFLLLLFKQTLHNLPVDSNVLVVAVLSRSPRPPTAAVWNSTAGVELLLQLHHSATTALLHAPAVSTWEIEQVHVC
jgi:hypothetical protein